MLFAGGMIGTGLSEELFGGPAKSIDKSINQSICLSINLSYFSFLYDSNYHCVRLDHSDE